MRNAYPKLLSAFLAMLLFCGNLQAQQNDFTSYKSLLEKNASRLGITAADVKAAVVSNAYTDPATQITYVYLQQAYQQVKVYNSIITVAFRNGSLLYTSGNFVRNIAAGATNATPAITFADAVGAAARHLNLKETAPVTIVKNGFDAGKNYTASPAGIAKQNIEVTLYWLPSDDKQHVTLAWNVNLDVKGREDWWNVQIDAQTGNFLNQDNWTVHEHLPNQATNCAAALPVAKKTGAAKGGPNPQLVLQSPPPNVTSGTYRVIPFPYESPIHTTFANVASPWLLAGATNNATTLGWHFDSAANYTITRGNNVFAFLDRRANNVADATNNWPDTSTTAAPALSFVHNFSTTAQPWGTRENKKAAVDNLFYWNNLMHDVTYQYGFTEVSGNFQRENLGRGGNGNDYVQANAQDSAGYDNANFSTPADGTSGRMQMYTWSTPSVFTVNSPATVAGTYAAVESVFSTANKLISTGPVTAQLVYYNDDAGGTTHEACSATGGAPASSIVGKIALIYRGTCGFIEKVKNAQNAGAIGVVMVNNVAGAPIAMGGTDNTITIPAMMISLADGNLIATQIANNEVVTLSSGIYLDGDLDNGIICHEYGHGVSTRLTGGPANSSCLNNAEQGGEGWSDYLGLMMTTNWASATLNDGPIARPIGTYAISQATTGSGIRRYPYSTNMSIDPLTYANMAASTEVHNIGEIWCSALWDMTWNLIQQQNAITTNLYNSTGTGGNTIAMNLVLTGMKLQPCQPGFLDARNAILAADSILYGYAHKCAIWNAFARRGMGFSAIQGLSTSATDQVAAYDLPSGLQVSKPVTFAMTAGAQTTISHVATCQCQPAANYIIRDTLPAGFTYISSTPSGTLSGNVLSFPATSFNALETKNFTITLQAPATGCAIDTVINDNRETATVGGFTAAGSASWTPSVVRAHTPASSWYGAESTAVTSGTLTSGSMAAASGKPLSILSFWHYYNTESSYDGGVVEYTTNGSTWTDAASLFLTNPYNTTMDASTTLAGRKAFSGTSGGGFIQTHINTSSFATTPVQFRFRMETDNGTGGDGWFVDDIVRANGCGGFMKTGVYNSSNVRQDTGILPIFVTSTATPVPVFSLIYFNATAVNPTTANRQSLLEWQTANELNVSRFIIEYSRDSLNWQSLDSVAGKNQTLNNYTYTHLSPVVGRNYYRLRMIYQNGTLFYSPVRLLIFPAIVVVTPTLPVTTLQLGPNPANSSATLYIPVSMPVRAANVYDESGRLMRRMYIASASANTTIVTIPTYGFAAGFYTVEVVTTNNEKHVLRMVVRH